MQGAGPDLALAWLLRPLAADAADPRLWALAAVALWLFWRAVAGPAAAARRFDAGQQQLAGALGAVTAAQARLAETLERQLGDVRQRMDETLSGSTRRTAHALGALHERLSAIDRAQSRIERLSGDVLGLQDILSNKQARGAFGEIQLADLVSHALPPDAYAFQATLSNGRRADCLIHLPSPPGPMVVDAKFPLEAWTALRAAETPKAKVEAQRAFRTAVRAHIAAIAERYILPGETAESALMFLPSEAVYADLHAHFGEVVREGFAARVWIVSPTTMMATLHTLRAVLRDTRLRAEAGAMRRELGLLHKDVARLMERVTRLDQHFEQARRDVEQIVVSAERASNRAARLETADFGPAAPETAPPRLAVLGGE